MRNSYRIVHQSGRYFLQREASTDERFKDWVCHRELEKSDASDINCSGGFARFEECYDYLEEVRKRKAAFEEFSRVKIVYQEAF